MKVCVEGYTFYSVISCLKYIFESIAGSIPGTHCRYCTSCNWCHICAIVAELSFREKRDGKESLDHPELILQIQNMELISSNIYQAAKADTFS